MRYNSIHICIAAVVICSGIAMAQDQDSTALKHRYSFTADAKDSAGHADGTLEGKAVIRDGQVYLDGTRGTYVNLPGGLIAGCDAVTFEFWATLGTNRNWARVFDQGSANGNQGGYDLYFSPHSGSRDFRLTAMAPHPTERIVTMPGNLDNQTNLHVACVPDPSSGFMGTTPTAHWPRRKRTSPHFPVWTQISSSSDAHSLPATCR